MNPSKNAKSEKLDVQKIIAELKAARADTAFHPTASRISQIFLAINAPARNLSEMQNLADEEKAIAIKQSSSTLKTFIRGIDDRRQAFDTLQSKVMLPRPPIGPAAQTPPPYIVLDKPFLIWPAHGMEMLDANYIPYGSFGKISAEHSNLSGSTELGFYFFWENPTNQPVVINVYSYLVFNGRIWAGGTQSRDPQTHDLICTGNAGLNIDAYLHTYRWWDQKPTEPLFESSQCQSVDSVSMREVGNMLCGSHKNVVQGIDPRYTLFQIIPSGVTVIEVSAVLQYGGDYVGADFSSGDFQIMCPYVLIEVVP